MAAMSKEVKTFAAKRADMGKARDRYGLIKVVQKLEIFSELDKEEALHILGLCARKAYEPGEVIWKPGDPGVDMLVLITGKLHVKDDQDQLVGQVLPGASFGEMACLTGHDRFVGFEAVEESTALSLSRDSLRALISTQPGLYVKILETTIELLAHRVSRASSGAAVKAEDGQPGLW